MNKTIFTILSAGLLFFSSCHVSKNTPSFADIEGEWDIVEIKGAPLNIGNDTPRPFIGFDTRDGRVYGNSGCNRIMSALNLNEKPGKIEFKQMASTMMACPDMELEKNVLGALSQVKSYKKSGKDEILLCDDSKRPVALLKKRFDPMNLADLQGEWNVVKVFGQPLSGKDGKQPFLDFDVAAKKISGNAGCNRIMGALETDETDKLSLSFPPVAATRMACPDMETERNILSALSSVKAFGRLNNKNVGLYTAGGVQVLELAKKQK